MYVYFYVCICICMYAYVYMYSLTTTNPLPVIIIMALSHESPQNHYGDDRDGVNKTILMTVLFEVLWTNEITSRQYFSSVSFQKTQDVN